MSKFRKIKLASAMLCTLLFGGNAGAMKEDVSEGISKNYLFENQKENKKLENRKSGDSDNKLLKYAYYVLGLGKLADEGVGVAQAKSYIGNKKLSPLGKLSIYKNLMARSYRAKTIETMKKLVGESHEKKAGIENFFWKVLAYCGKHYMAFKSIKLGIFDVGVHFEEYLDINEICRRVSIGGEGVPQRVKEYVKAVLGVSVEECDKILVSLVGGEKYYYIAFVKGNVCLKLSPFNESLEFRLSGINEDLVFDSDNYKLDLYDVGDCYIITLPYMERILGVKHDDNYFKKVEPGPDDVAEANKLSYSFYGQIFRDLEEDWKGNTPSGKKFAGNASKIFPGLFEKKLEIIDE